MSIFVSDTFTEGSNTTLASHTPDVGGAWVPQNGAPSTMDVVASGDYATGHDGTQTWYYNNATPPSADYYAEADVSFHTGTNEDWAMLMCRMNADSDGYYMYWFNGNANIDFGWRVGLTNTYNSLGTFAYTPTLSIADKWRIQAVGTTIKVFVNGVEKASVTDSNYSTANFAGLMARDGARIDNYVAATVGGGGGGSGKGHYYYDLLRRA